MLRSRGFRLGILLVALLGIIVGDLRPSHGQEPSTHYLLARPLPATANRTPEYGYAYGGTRRGQLQVHHGMDYSNRRGTPVLAAGDGTVYYAGSDLETVFGASTNFYGNLVVIQHPFSAEGGVVYSLYGHLSVVGVKTGDVVKQGQTIGAVGSTGVAFGSHLHFEVRIGDPRNYFAVRNAELWYPPLAGRAKLIGKLLNADGTRPGETRVTLTTATALFYTFTYADPLLPSDAVYGENFVLGDLPPGCYKVRVRGQIGFAVDEQLCFKANETQIATFTINS